VKKESFVRESSTVLLLRDGPRGIEVFMVRRRLKSDFVGGAYVFPGGGLDPTDTEVQLLERLRGADTLHWSERLNLPADRAGAHIVAAIRETFEEAGVLLAEGPGGVPSHDHRPATHWRDQRQALLAGALTWPELIQAHDLNFPADRIAYFAHWITPEGVPKRFSTRFFVVAAPDDHEALADDREVEAGVWITPTDALEAKRSGGMTIVLPTQRALEAIAPFASAQAVVSAYRDRPIDTILPRIVLREGRVLSLFPGDPGYAEAEGEPVPPFDPSVL